MTERTTRTTTGALGLFVVGLALAALAAQPGARTAPAVRVEARGQARPSAPPASSPELRRLRDGGKLDPNRASAAELELLPGIGPALASRILEDRARNGPYRAIADLGRVRGIGARRLADLARLVEIAPDERPAERNRPPQGSGWRPARGLALEKPDEPEHDRDLHRVAVERRR